MTLDTDTTDRLIYAFGHLVSSYRVEDAHAGDSGGLALDVLYDMEFTEREIAIIEALAEHVFGNYEFTGEGMEILRRIKAGEL